MPPYPAGTRHLRNNFINVESASRAARRDLADRLLLDIVKTGIHLGGI
jgi:hypothetical protein